MYLQGKDPVYGVQMLIVYAAVSVLPAPAVGAAEPYAVLAGSACSFPLFRLPCALHLFGVPWSRTSHILWQGLVFDSCGVRLWLGAPDHIPARERSRLRCPNVDRIRRRFRSSSPGCWYSGAIRGCWRAVRVPSLCSACSAPFILVFRGTEPATSYGRALFRSMRSPPMAWSARPYTCKGKIPFTVPKC